MKIIKGNLITLALRGEFDVIIHGCNCFCTMGGGIARDIKLNFLKAYELDKNTKKGDIKKLGTISYAELDINNKKLIVVNAYTQFNFLGASVLVDYDALRNCFKEIKNKFTGKKIAYPAIGAGLAGGDWHIISKIIDEELEGENHIFVEFSN